MCELYNLFPCSDSIFSFRNDMVNQIFKSTPNPAKPKPAFKSRSNAIKTIYPLNYAHNSYYQQ